MSSRINIRAYHRRWFQARVDANLCVRCGAPSETKWCESCRQRRQAYDRQRYQAGMADHQKLKREIFEVYGGQVCVCCGESHIEFLTLDHVQGRGSEHRRSLTGTRAGPHFYRRLKALGFPKRPALQVMCLNCNWAKGHGGCPHEHSRARHQ